MFFFLWGILERQISKSRSILVTRRFDCPARSSQIKLFHFFFFAGLKVVGSRSITVFSLEKSLAIFAKIAILQGATIGIQLKLSEAGDFSPFLPFSPLHAILDLSGNGGAFWWFVFVIVFLYILKQVSSKNFKPYIWWQTF